MREALSFVMHEQIGTIVQVAGYRCQRNDTVEAEREEELAGQF